jgi:DNA polymerase (family X)
MTEPLNATVAARLDEVATLLEEQHANPFRVSAYRRGADTLRGLPSSIADLVEREGLDGLERLPGIGESLARSIRALVLTGRLPMLDRLRGEGDPETLLMSLPGLGRIMAARLHNKLGIDSLEALEVAAFDGRLLALVGVGPKRLTGIRDVLAQRLGRVSRTVQTTPRPLVATLLEVDAEYREKVKLGSLRRIAPRRFNPSGEAWLPVLHTRRGEVEYTAMYSNTMHAHAQSATRDWVVIIHDAGHGERASTVLTATRGALKGRRIMVGRERECEQHYLHQDATFAPEATVVPATVSTRSKYSNPDQGISQAQSDTVPGS